MLLYLPNPEELLRLPVLSPPVLPLLLVHSRIILHQLLNV